MGFNDLLKKLFGNKSQRDLKEIEPYIQKRLFRPNLKNCRTMSCVTVSIW